MQKHYNTYFHKQSTNTPTFSDLLRLSSGSLTSNKHKQNTNKYQIKIINP